MTTSTKVSNNYIAQNLSLQTLENETWKPIKGYEGYYCVSNKGRIKRLKSYRKYITGKNHVYPEKILKQEKSKGYLRVTFSLKNIQKRILTHRLVASHFIKNPLDKPCVNHKDGNKFNNSVNNLEWVTYSENEIHSYKKLGKVNPIRVLKENEVKDILQNAKKANKNRCLYKGNIKKYALKYSVDVKTIHNILNHKYYV